MRSSKLYWPLLIIVCFLVACSTKSESGSNSANVSSTKFQQYYIQGEQLYLTHCSNCHQKNGTGLGLLFPPLNKSDYVDNNIENVVCIMKNGIRGELQVNGKSFNKEMKGIPSLSNLEVAEITTYIYNSWGRDKGLIDVQAASVTLSHCDSMVVNP